MNEDCNVAKNSYVFYHHILRTRSLFRCSLLRHSWKIFFARTPCSGWRLDLLWIHLIQFGAWRFLRHRTAPIIRPFDFVYVLVLNERGLQCGKEFGRFLPSHSILRTLSLAVTMFIIAWFLENLLCEHIVFRLAIGFEFTWFSLELEDSPEIAQLLL